METKEKLKPCPFCGGNAEIKKGCTFGGNFYFVKCKKCSSEGERKYGKSEAIAAWNRRVCCEKKPETLDTNGSCTKKSYTCEEIETMRKKLEYYEADAGGASVADLLEENRRLRAGLPSLLDSSPKPTYEELEKMVKPLEWHKGAIGWVSHISHKRFVIEQTSENEFCVNKVGYYNSLEEAKAIARGWLVDLVAAALGVGRSAR